jgi:hypothetical protein
MWLCTLYCACFSAAPVDLDVAAAAAAGKAQVKQYQQEGFTTTVSVMNLSMGDR